MAGTMNDVFTTMLTQNQSEEEPLFNEELLLFNLLQERSRKQLEAIYVAANMHPNTVIPLKTPEMELLLRNGRLYVNHWSPSISPMRVGELVLRVMLLKYS